MKLRLVKEGQFIGTKCDFYVDEETKDIYMTRKQIGEALKYKDPDDGIYRVHKRNEDFLNNCYIEASSRQFVDTSKPSYFNDFPNSTIFMYNERGIYLIVLKSQQSLSFEFYNYVYEMLHDISHKGYYLASKKDNEWLGLRERGINTRRNWVHEIENKMILDSRDEIDDFIERLSRTVKIELGIPYNPDYDEYHQRDSWSCEDLYRVMEIEEEMCEYVKSMDMDGFFGCFSDIDKVSVYNHLIEVCAKHQI